MLSGAAAGPQKICLRFKWVCVLDDADAKAQQCGQEAEGSICLSRKRPLGHCASCELIERLAGAMEYQPGRQQFLCLFRKAGCQKPPALLVNRHVKLVVRHTAFPMKMIAAQIRAIRFQLSAYLGVEGWRMAFLTQFMDGLVGKDKVEFSEAFAPAGVAQIALDKLHATACIAKALPCQLMHHRREV